MSKVKYGDVQGIELSLSWQPASGGHAPDGAVTAGDSCYIARARHGGEWIPGKLPAGHTSAYVAYGESEHAYSEYEVLVATDVGIFGSDYEWKHATGGSVPKRAVVGGSDSGEPLFIARAKIEGEMCSGKAQPRHGCAYFPWGGSEHKMDQFEVLVLK